jgi:hypothetical protein
MAPADQFLCFMHHFRIIVICIENYKSTIRILTQQYPVIFNCLFFRALGLLLLEFCPNEPDKPYGTPERLFKDNIQYTNRVKTGP